ncbi:type II and III secretion system protein family protein, partial [Noviherbaspirillum denitrificans]|uniref:type II and III secretion system protein family protein n=1 Tax=Noviherbaspirillum denitrificans TaxID=1968433 RepID=UPI000B52AC6B
MNRDRTHGTQVSGAQRAVLAGFSAIVMTATMHAEAAPPAPARDSAKTTEASRSVATPVCTGEFASSKSVTLPEGKSGQLDLQQLGLPSPAFLRTVGDPHVVQVEPTVSPSPRSMFFVFGKRVGSTNLMFQTKEGRCAMVEVTVGVDGNTVQERLQALLPGEKDIRVSSAADSLVLSGTVSDAVAAEKALLIASAYMRKTGTGASPGSGGSGGALGGTGNGDGPKISDRIVNMLSLAAPQQVMLEVKVAEISKTLLDKLGVNLAAIGHHGSWTSILSSNFMTDGAGLLSLTKDTGERVLIDAEKRDGLVKVLAEPTVMAISGQEGSFLAGGKVFIPVAQNNTNGVLTITLEEKEFGVGLKFTPTVLDGGRINLKVAPEVSELSREGIGINARGIGGTAVLPLITTRRASTTVQLFDGQSFAIGGLIKNNVTQNMKAMPVLGEIPVLGALFRSADFQTDRSELIFVVTPRLVKPLPPNYGLPTDHFIEPSRSEFFLGGKMEGKAPPPPAANTSSLPPPSPAKGDAGP